jgi:predicted nucleic acid-binding protein
MNDLYVLDACALIALLRNEDGAEIVEGVFRKALEDGTTIVMNKLNLLEVYYDTCRLYDKETADKVLENIKQLPIVIQSELTDEVLKEAGRLKSSYRISIADSVALGEALVSGGTLLTSDHHEFDVIEKSESIKLHWIR